MRRCTAAAKKAVSDARGDICANFSRAESSRDEMPAVKSPFYNASREAGGRAVEEGALEISRPKSAHREGHNVDKSQQANNCFIRQKLQR